MLNWKCTLLFAQLAICFPGRLDAQTVAFPLMQSENKRYLEDSNHKPFFYQAETPWGLFLNLNPAEAGELMDIRLSQGFNVLQVMALPMNAENPVNVFGEHPFMDNDFSKPNEAYWLRIREGIKLAHRKGLLIGLAVAWKGCCGGDWNKTILDNGPEKCKSYGQFLGRWFASCDNLFFIQGGDSDPQEHTDHYREIALGIQEFMPAALQTYHASSGHSSSDMMNYLDHGWMNFCWTYTYFPQKYGVWIYIMGLNKLPHVYAMNHIEYRKYPVKPFVLGESQYEGEDTSSYAPLTGAEVARRQAYWSILSGGCGHAYGSWNWPIKKDWRRVVADPGANQMKHVRKFFESLPWYQLVPDVELKLISQGAGTYGSDDFIVAAITADTTIFVAYLPPTGSEKRTFTLEPNLFNQQTKMQWFNPYSGSYAPASGVFLPSGSLSFESPGENGSEFNDWILLLEKK